MESKNIAPDSSISLFVMDILVFEETDLNKETILPFFADGYPGLMFQFTANGLFIRPHNKAMPVLFLYGQTIQPIELLISGSYQLIVFQLYPFVIKSFFEVNPKDLNDKCYDLAQGKNRRVEKTIDQLLSNGEMDDRIKQISSFLYTNFKAKKDKLDFTVRAAIQLILDHQGQDSVGKLPAQLHVTGRTLERRFINEVGLSLKHFARIIQFQTSLEQLAAKDYSKLSDIVYANGYADQSHFIKVFKAYTGKTPKKFQQ